MTYKTNKFYFLDKNGKKIWNKNPNEFCYGVKCDCCGAEFGTEDFAPALFPYEDEAVSEACGMHDWIKYEGKHFCPECIDYNEDKDEYVSKKK